MLLLCLPPQSPPAATASILRATNASMMDLWLDSGPSSIVTLSGPEARGSSIKESQGGDTTPRLMIVLFCLIVGRSETKAQCRQPRGG